MRRLEGDQQAQVEALLLQQQQGRALETMRSHHTAIDRDRMGGQQLRMRPKGGGKTNKIVAARAWR